MTRCALVLLVALALAGCASGGSGSSQAAAHKEPVASVSPTPSPAPGTACSVNHRPKVLPRWARSGFSGPKPSVGYVLGDSGNIAAIMFVSHHSLSSPPVAGQNNKILWAARVGAVEGPLQIKAALGGTGQTVTRTVDPAPGPSIIDLPSPGCWSFDLTWGTHHDHLQLGYASG